MTWTWTRRYSPVGQRKRKVVERDANPIMGWHAVAERVVAAA